MAQWVLEGRDKGLNGIESVWFHSPSRENPSHELGALLSTENSSSKEVTGYT
jgi:hypothetical protein